MTEPAELLREERDGARARLELLDAELDELRADRGRESADDEHDPEGATLSGEWSRLSGLRSAALAELADIDAALARVGAAAYGVCVDCGGLIPDARLEVRPTATRCVECASKAGR
ncbi:TraR/DksA C4-type zinc finger protein [Microbacterium sp. BK668]|uniref:TraR/DksA family transcriptional regulator n=1 Tax=Microbacterium sp. BK668 TaxID=2512118 RepID=UPI0010DC0ED3|nr:TraR/DksA C4-type zinc finger protein [Microbacterium sp. BK668]TDN93143.1 TraR/DksA family transcriptional regulator [Microbacterium sp. BK668]